MHSYFPDDALVTKKRLYIVIGILVVAIAPMGVISYRKLTQIDLSSGMLRVERRVFGMAISASRPEKTSLSEALHSRTSIPDWCTVAEEEFDFPPYRRISFCYAKLMTHIRRIDQGFMEPEATTALAMSALQELNRDRDICATANHMGRVWDRLMSYDQPGFSDSMIHDLWETTKTEQDTSLGAHE
jgi:hypothetical protein